MTERAPREPHPAYHVPPPLPERSARRSLDDLLLRARELEASDLFLIAGAPPTVAVEGRHVRLDERPLIHEDLARLTAPLLTPEREAAFAARPDLDLPAVLGERALDPRGLFLVTGAASTGKSTTLAAMLDARSERLEGHIVAIEDPIEFAHRHRRSIVTQREVGLDTASYHDALRSALRQAPDLLVLGELRDRETAEAALRFADTGHLVMATLHATNTVQALERVVSLFPEEMHGHVLMLLSLTLTAVASQRLVLRADGAGSRVAAVELLEATQRVRDAIRRGDWPTVRVALGEGGGSMTAFDDALLRLIRDGVAEREDAVRHADSPADLLLRLRLEGAGALGRAERRQLRLV